MRIIFLSNQLFDFPLKTNKWHVATRVAKSGHEVLFVDPPIRLRKLAKQILEGRWSLKRLLTSSYEALVDRHPEFISGSDKMLNPLEHTRGRQVQHDKSKTRNIKRPYLNVFTPLSQSVSEAPNLTAFNIARMRKQFLDFFDGEAVLWVYNSAMDEYIEKIPYRLLVYDCVDDYPSMANYARLGLSGEIAEKEKKIAKEANVVFATTETLAKKLSQYSENVHYVGNAGDYERFSPVGKARFNLGDKIRHSEFISESDGKILNQVQDDLKTIPRPRIGFTGAIDAYKLNLPLLVKAAKTYPDHSFVIVGPQAVADTQPNLAELKKLSNVYLIGQRPYEEMPSFFAGFDVYVIPYNLNDYTLKGCFPVKFFDALAAGLPTVVTDLPSYASFSEFCYLAKSDEEFTKAIQIALEENSPERIKAQMKVAQENSWDRKVERMLEIVRKHSGTSTLC